jgi:uncharacterized DUF497 family protein
LIGVSFEEAATAVIDPDALIDYDVDHASQEDRFTIIGMSHRPRHLFVVTTDRGEVTRIISARHATPAERQRYETEPR